MGWTHGFMQAAGEAAHQQNMLDLETKQKQYTNILALHDKLIEDPNVIPEEKLKIYQNKARLQTLGPLKVKSKDFDMSSFMMTKNQYAPRQDMDSEGKTTNSYLGLHQVPPETNEFSGPLQPEQTAPAVTQPPPVYRPITYSREELANMDAEKQALQWQQTASYRAEAKGSSTSPMLKDHYRVDDMKLKLKMAGQPDDPYLNTLKDTDTVQGVVVNGKWYVSPPVVQAARTVTGLFDKYGNPAIGVREGDEVREAQNPDNLTMSAPTDNHILELETKNGEKQFVVYKTYKANNSPVLKDGHIELAYTNPPAGYLPTVSNTLKYQQNGGVMDPFRSISTNSKTLPGSVFSWDSNANRLTLNGIPVYLMGQPMGNATTPPPVPGSAPVAAPVNTTQNPGMVPPPTPGQNPADLSSSNLPFDRNSQGSIATIKQTPVQIASTDKYAAAAPKIDYNSPFFTSTALNTESAIAKKANPFLSWDPKINPLLDPNFIPANVVAVPDPNDKENKESMLVDDSPQWHLNDKKSSGIHDPRSGETVFPNVKSLTTMQMGTYELHAGVMGTTASLLTDLLQPDAISVFMKKDPKTGEVSTNYLNAFRMIVVGKGTAGELIANVLSKFDNITPQEKALLEKVAGIRQNLTEHVQTIRSPLGAAGFRSLEAFRALQAQFGDPYMPPQMMLIIMRNTLKTVLTIQSAYTHYLNLSKRIQKDPTTRQPMAGPNYPDSEIQRNYMAAYETSDASQAAMLRNNYVEPPARPIAKPIPKPPAKLTPPPKGGR